MFSTAKARNEEAKMFILKCSYKMKLRRGDFLDLYVCRACAHDIHISNCHK